MDLKDPNVVREVFSRGAAACRDAACRHGSIESIHPPGTLVATGDLHDNPMHFAALTRACGLVEPATLDDAPPAPARAHLLLHEIIHPDRLVNGMDFSYRVLARAAALKARYPEHVHVLLGNHELAQLTNASIVKDGIKSVDAFRQGLEYVFADEAGAVESAMNQFIKALPLALRCATPRGDILCAHSLPPAAVMARFDPGVLSRDLTDEDYEPRRGAAYLMVWGRGYDPELLEDLVERWGVAMFILGHEKVDAGAMFVPPNAIVLNSDHARGVYLPIDLANPPRPDQALAQVVALASSGETPWNA